MMAQLLNTQVCSYELILFYPKWPTVFIWPFSNSGCLSTDYWCLVWMQTQRSTNMWGGTPKYMYGWWIPVSRQQQRFSVRNVDLSTDKRAVKSHPQVIRSSALLVSRPASKNQSKAKNKQISDFSKKNFYFQLQTQTPTNQPSNLLSCILVFKKWTQETTASTSHR